MPEPCQSSSRCCGDRFIIPVIRALRDIEIFDTVSGLRVVRVEFGSNLRFLTKCVPRYGKIFGGIGWKATGTVFPMVGSNPGKDGTVPRRRIERIG